MADREEWKGNVVMAVSYCTPEKILHHAVVFILPRAPVMQVHIIFAKAVMLKKGVYPTDNSNHTVSSLISQEVDLARNCFTVYSKHCAFEVSTAYFLHTE